MAKTKVTKSSGNVFADLGVRSPAQARAKAELARRISEIISEQELTQEEAADILGIDQPKVSALTRGQLSGFSTERLFKFLNNLDRDIEIVVRPVFRKKKATVRVVSESSVADST